jgi:mRNA export factor
MAFFGGAKAQTTFGAPSSTSFGAQQAATSSDYEVPNPPNDSISSLCWSPTHNILAASSWDNEVRAYEVQQQGTQFQATPKAMIKFAFPLLC